MKKELFVHLLFLIVFLFLVSLFKGWFQLSFWLFWLGGLFGTFLPDLDHLVYVYFLKPEEFTSQRVGQMIGERDLGKSAQLLADTREERETLIFHTIYFQVIFVIAAFLIISSSGSLFGRGLVLAFLLHFLVDQGLDIKKGMIGRWFNKLPFSPSNDFFKKYWWGMIAILLLFGFLL